LTFARIDPSLATQRVDGEGRLAVSLVDGRTRLSDLFQRGAGKIRLPRSSGDPLEAVLINTAGGMTGGDRLDWSVGLGPGSAAILTTQACEKAYRSTAGTARIRTRLAVAEHARLGWLPQETILYDGSALDRTLEIELGEGASALVVESVIVGRRAMGETVTRASFRDTWRIRQGGRLVHADALSLRGDLATQISHAAVARGATAFATVLLISPAAERQLDPAREIVGSEGGASHWQVGTGPGARRCGKLLARIVAKDGYDLRRRLVPLLALLNEEAALPRVWST
jgi:urease accessory protein